MLFMISSWCVKRIVGIVLYIFSGPVAEQLAVKNALRYVLLFSCFQSVIVEYGIRICQLLYCLYVDSDQASCGNMMFILHSTEKGRSELSDT